jgi:hypothetical protein
VRQDNSGDRGRLYRSIFTAAAVYNAIFGLWAGFWPQSFFTRFDLALPNYPAIWSCLGMVVGVYALGYAYAARHLDRAAPFIAIGLLGKLLGPAGWIATVASGEWPVRTLTLIVFNDVIWWLPFALFLVDGARVGATVRRAAPVVCAVLNLIAMLAMAAWLRFGTEIVPLPADRIRYITSHATLWRAGWSIWMAAAISLVAFYAWWAGHLRRSTWAMAGVAVAIAGLMCDLSGESLLIGWLPRDYDRLAPLATQLTGTAANGLYTLAGVILTLATPDLGKKLRFFTWTVWIAGASVTVSTLARIPIAIAVSTTWLFVLFCPWVLLLGRALQGGDVRLKPDAT